MCIGNMKANQAARIMATTQTTSPDKVLQRTPLTEVLVSLPIKLTSHKDEPAHTVDQGLILWGLKQL